MKKSNKRGNLHLTSEAVRTLTNTQLEVVAGAGNTYGGSCQGTCGSCNCTEGSCGKTNM